MSQPCTLDDTIDGRSTERRNASSSSAVLLRPYDVAFSFRRNSIAEEVANEVFSQLRRRRPSLAVFNCSREPTKLNGVPRAEAELEAIYQHARLNVVFWTSGYLKDKSYCLVEWQMIDRVAQDRPFSRLIIFISGKRRLEAVQRTIGRFFVEKVSKIVEEAAATTLEAIEDRLIQRRADDISTPGTGGDTTARFDEQLRRRDILLAVVMTIVVIHLGVDIAVAVIPRAVPAPSPKSELHSQRDDEAIPADRPEPKTYRADVMVPDIGELPTQTSEASP